jgi:hypothetical protein
MERNDSEPHLRNEPSSSAFSDDDAAAQLMARLGSQFGDLDLTQLHVSLKQQQPQQEPGCETDGPGEKTHVSQSNCINGSSSDESSLEDPTPEELVAWQAQQFRKGQQVLQRQQEETMDPMQKRRLALRHNTESKEEDDDWEEISALPDLQDQSSVFFTEADDAVVIGVSPLLRALATSPQGDPELLGTAWQRLYSSVEGDGLSFWNLRHAICHYDGPTLLMFRVVPSRSKMVLSKNSVTLANVSSSATIGFLTTTTWQESAEYHGNHSDHDTAFMFAMDENNNRVEFFGMQKQSKEKAGNRAGYMYCHPSTISTKNHGGKSYHNDNKHGYHEKTNGAVHGIGIGGKPSQPRLHLTETLEECRCLTYDSGRIFQDGNLFLNKPAFEDSLYYFDMESIEVWGVGGKAWIRDALEARDKARGVAASNLQQRRRIYDKSQLLDDFRTGLHSTTTKSAANASIFDHVVYSSDRCDV